MFKKLIVLFIIFILPACYANITPDYNKSEKYLVYNGYIPEEDDDIYTKYMVSIANLGQFNVSDEKQFGKGHICAGIIIGQRTILTAAHCLTKYKKEKLVVIAGAPVRLRKSYSTQIVYVANTVIHHLYKDSNSPPYDVGIIYLNKSLRIYNDRVMIFRDFPYHGCDLEPGTKCTLLGWGRVGDVGQKSVEIRYIDMVVFKKSFCDKKLRPIVKTFCAGEANGGPGGACKGDSGGPIFCDGILSGLVSSGLNCSDVNPTYFTEVCQFVNWIRDNSLDFISYRSSSQRKLHENIYFQMLSIIIFFLYIIL